MIYIGIDPGQSGAVAIIENSNVSVFDAPMKKVEKTGKKDYDIAAMAAILHPYYGKPVTIIIEAVFSMTQQGVSSVFNFGRGKGLWEGIAWAYGFNVHMVTPQKWKKYYVSLAPPAKDPLAPKKPKEAKPKTKNEKKEAAKQKRLVKALAKEKARTLAGEMYPQLKDRFKTVNSDGRAEAVLIAHYAEKNYTESK